MGDDFIQLSGEDMTALAYMAAGGIVPLLSFFAERRVHAEVSAQLEEARS